MHLHQLSTGREVGIVRRKTSSQKHSAEAIHDDQEIRIDPSVRRRSRRELELLIHELTHFEVPQMAEDTVLRLAHSAARLLWNLGWRDLSK